jgi:hypothetical protein
MTALTAPFTVAALVLALGGALKAWAPQGTAGALRGLGLPHHTWLVRAGGAAELALGTAAVVTGDRLLAALIALSYAAFVAFVVLALRADAPLSSCGCLGKLETPPHLVHVVLDATAFAAAAAVAIVGGDPLVDVLGDQPLGAVPYVALVTVAVAAVVTAMVSLPQVLRLARERAQ